MIPASIFFKIYVLAIYTFIVFVIGAEYGKKDK